MLSHTHTHTHTVVMTSTEVAVMTAIETGPDVGMMIVEKVGMAVQNTGGRSQRKDLV